MKKVLFLGGAKQQIVAIQYAKKQGYYTVLCDYLPDNPGREIVDKYYCVSTTDQEAVLKVSKLEKIDGIVAYSSEPAITTAAFVGNQLGLPSNPYDSVFILTNKQLFRGFLEENDFNHPISKSFTTIEHTQECLSSLAFPMMVKPVDSSGSRGISRIESIEEFERAFELAMSFSKSQTVIVEEYIEMNHSCIVGGDIFVENGKIAFWGLLNGYRDISNNSFVPFGNSHPVFLDETKVNIIKKELQRIVDLLTIKTGPVNIEMIFDDNDKPYVVEMSPRNGGNMISELIQLSTGVDLIKATVEAALGHNIQWTVTKEKMFYATYYLHANEMGFLKKVNIHNEIVGNIIRREAIKKMGDEIGRFTNLYHAIEIIFMKFSTVEEMQKKMGKIDNLITVDLEPINSIMQIAQP